MQLELKKKLDRWEETSPDILTKIERQSLDSWRVFGCMVEGGWDGSFPLLEVFGLETLGGRIIPNENIPP